MATTVPNWRRLLRACLPALYEQRKRLMHAERRKLDELIEQIEKAVADKGEPQS